ncbi:hypothetical protein W03_20970 [Nitrosomonas sp. PY1]|uniref:hypothetical protein n=1 Tax=Nitrosomonas sp. PY1 TaxID=1803906 RepID=UPI001FC87322|nr:hypothetical protein [Nitrosomonas sp. PY1]GKS70093.1 hypothetical protein W03_20970 [Nitrosomonas sp. PY1]
MFLLRRKERFDTFFSVLLFQIVLTPLFLSGVSWIIANPSQAAGASYTIKQIGELPLGATHVVRTANEGGDIVGTIKRSGRSGPKGAIWEDGGERSIVQPRPNSDYSVALGINDDNQVVGSANTETGMRAYRSIGNSSVFLELPSGDNSSAAITVNGLGQVVGWSSGAGGIRAVTWDSAGKVKVLEKLQDSNACRALVINDAGDIAGTCDFNSGHRAVLWKSASGKGVTDLGMLPGDIWSVPADINNKGDIVGTSGDAEKHRAVLWPKGERAIKDLGVLTGRVSSKALGINTKGDVVGYSEGGNSSEHAFIWTSKDGMMDLNNLLPANSGFVVVHAIAINSKGDISVIGYDESMNPERHLHDEQIPLRIFRLDNNTLLN